jgi:hypothetical protein
MQVSHLRGKTIGVTTMVRVSRNSCSIQLQKPGNDVQWQAYPGASPLHDGSPIGFRDFDVQSELAEQVVSYVAERSDAGIASKT